MAQKQKYKYEGEQIIVAGKPGENGIIVFSHMFQDGTAEHIGLRMNHAYVVGGLDEHGVVIKDWVFESFSQSDLNHNRKKSQAEIQMEEHEAKGGNVTAQSGAFLN